MVAVLAGCASTAEPTILKSDVEPEHAFAAGQTFFVRGPTFMTGRRSSSNTGTHDSSDEANARNKRFEQLVRSTLEERGWVTATPDDAQHRVEFRWKSEFHRSVTRIGSNSAVDADSTAAMGIRIYSLDEKRWVWKSEGKFNLARVLDDTAQVLIVARLFKSFPLAPASDGAEAQVSPRRTE